MLGGIIGDIVGSIYEFHNIKTKEFPLLSEKCGYTDDSILTIATAKWILEQGLNNNDLPHLLFVSKNDIDEEIRDKARDVYYSIKHRKN